MKVTSAILTTMSGKLGGAVASKARGGIQYFRKLVIPRNPRSFLQTAIRNATAGVSSAWKATLTQTQRDAWIATESGGATGQTLFMNVNNPRIYAENANKTVDVAGVAASPTWSRIDTPPASYSTLFTDPTTQTIDVSDDAIHITGCNPADTLFTDTAAGKPALIYVFASRPQSASRNSRQYPYQLIATIQVLNTDEPTDVDVSIDASSAGFALVAGEVMYLKLQGQHPLGGLSVPLEGRIVIQA